MATVLPECQGFKEMAKQMARLTKFCRDGKKRRRGGNSFVEMATVLPTWQKFRRGGTSDAETPTVLL
jgi:hypothetical protein